MMKHVLLVLACESALNVHQFLVNHHFLRSPAINSTACQFSTLDALSHCASQFDYAKAAILALHFALQNLWSRQQLELL